MFRNYVLTALRNMAKHRLHACINLFGLAVGLACVIFTVLFVREETSFDTWLPDTKNLYRVEVTLRLPGRPAQDLASTPFEMSKAMKDEIPEVVGFTRLALEPMTITVGDRQFSDRIDVVDPQFLKVIGLPLQLGNPAQVLSQPQSLVISKSLAKKYFGDADPIGRTVSVSDPNCADNDKECLNTPITLTITGVMRDLPSDTQLVADALLPNTSLADRIKQRAKENWTSFGAYSFVNLASGSDPQSVINKMTPILDRALTDRMKQFGLSMRGSDALSIHLTPFTKVHLDSAQYLGNMTPAGSWATVYGVGLIGALILLIACFNYTNLATARALLRAREISLRKCVGARRRQLVVQFLGESVMMSLIAMAFALALVEIFLPWFGNYLGRAISLSYFGHDSVLLPILGIAVAAGLISGSYPALVLSGIQPARILRANALSNSGSGKLRDTLVIFQFAVSIGLGIAMGVVFSQINYARNIDLGFQHDRVIILTGAGRLTPSARDSLSQTLIANKGILNIGLSNRVPFDEGENLGVVEVPGTPGQISLDRISISPDFATVYQIPMVSGRMFSRLRGDDTFIDGASVTNEGHNVILNQAAAHRLGLTPLQAIGKTIIFNRYHVKIIGVVPDIKFDGAREKIKPTIYYNDESENTKMSVRTRLEGLPATIAFIDGTWHAFSPEASSDRYFLDDSFNKLYQSDQHQGTMFGIFVTIAILIACLGLFGLAAFTAARRTKEIGLRKVFGARIRDVVLLLLWQFSIPVLIANLLAWPPAWYYLQNWLQGYANRISLSPLYFVGAGLVALAIAWATILAHALRVARASPINALRYE